MLKVRGRKASCLRSRELLVLLKQVLNGKHIEFVRKMSQGRKTRVMKFFAKVCQEKESLSKELFYYYANTIEDKLERRSKSR